MTAAVQRPEMKAKTLKHMS